MRWYSSKVFRQPASRGFPESPQAGERTTEYSIGEVGFVVRRSRNARIQEGCGHSQRHNFTGATHWGGVLLKAAQNVMSGRKFFARALRDNAPATALADKYFVHFKTRVSFKINEANLALLAQRAGLG